MPHMGAGSRLHIRSALDEQLRQVHGLQLRLAPLIQAREGQQILHKTRHALGLRINTRERRLTRLTERFSPAEHIGVALNGRQWRTKLMRGIRNEGTNLMLGPFTHLQRRIHVIQQLVEGVTYRTNLSTRVRITRLHAHSR